MTPEKEVPSEDGVPVFVRLRDSLPDVVGLVGFGMLARGLWVGFGEAVSLSVCGLVLMAMAGYAIIRGGS